MTEKPYSEIFKQLVEDFNNRKISTVEYRIQRRALLADVDAYYNGAVPRAEPPDELRTQPNPKRL